MSGSDKRKMAQNVHPKSKEPKQHVKIIDVMGGKEFEGATNLHGFNFQTKIMCLYLCLAHDLNNVRLATEIKAAGKFDDLILKYEKTGENHSRYCFLQAKQTFIPNLKITPIFLENNENFNLKKYFQTYVQIREQFCEDKIPPSSIEYLIMFTNADFNFECFSVITANEQGDETKINLRQILNPQSPLIPNNSFQFAYIPPKLSKMIYERDDHKSLFEEYINKLIFAVNQPNYNQIDVPIKQILGRNFNIVESDSVFNQIVGKMWSIFSQTVGREISQQFGKFFEEFYEELVNRTFLSGVTFSKRNDKLVFENYFKDTTLLTDFLDKTKSPLNRITSETPALTCLKAAQALYSIFGKYRTYPELYFAVADLPTLLKNKDLVLHSLESKNEFVLVIKWDERDVVSKPQVDKLMAQLTSIIKTEGKDPKKKIVFVGDSKCNFSKFNMKPDMLKSIKDVCCYVDITDEAKKLLIDTVITFQGSDGVAMADLIDKSDLETMKYITDLCNKLTEIEDFRIGKSMQDLWPLDPYYIERQFKINFKFCKEILGCLPDTELLVLSGVDQSKMEAQFGNKKMITFKDNVIDEISECTIILLDAKRSEAEDLKLIFNRCRTKNIHYLVKTGDNFILKESSLNVDITETDIMESVGRLKIITGEPGIGKSVLLTSILHTIKCEPRSWVIRINLLDVCRDLAKMNLNEFHDLESTLELLCKVEEMKNKYEKELLRYYITKTDYSFLLFDGFDEICPTHEAKVLAMLKLLRNTKAKIWVTTRPHFQDKLEDELSHFSYSLVAFSEDDQKFYLQRFWSSTLDYNPQASDDAITDFILRFLEVFIHFRIKSVGQFIGIPLQTQMLAVIYQEDCERFCESPTRDLKINTAVGVLELYNKFIARKYQLFFETKAQLNESIPNNANLISVNEQSFTEQHQKLAIQLLFQDKFEFLVTSEVFKNPHEEVQLINVGLVLSRNKQLSFLHRTFAEYFVAKYLAQVLEEDPGSGASKHQLVRNFLREQYFLQANTMIRIFLDHQLARSSEILKAVINDDLARMAEILEGDSAHIDSPDILGRTPWLLAAGYSKYWNLDGQNRLTDYSYYHVRFAGTMVSCIMEILWIKKNSLEICKVDALGFNVFCHGIGSIDPNSNITMYLVKILPMQTMDSIRKMSSMVYEVLDLAYFLDREPLIMKTFLNSFIPGRSLDFWKSKTFRGFFRENANNFQKMVTILRIASPEFTADLYPLEFVNYTMVTENYFSELLADKTIDLSKLKKVKDFTRKREFRRWCRHHAEHCDFAILDEVHKIFGFEITLLPNLDYHAMFRKAVEDMNNKWVVELIGFINYDWKSIDYVSYFKTLFYSRRFEDFESAYVRLRSKALKEEVIGKVNSVLAFRDAILEKDLNSLAYLFNIFETAKEIETMKASVGIPEVVDCFRFTLRSAMVFRSQPFLRCINNEEHEHVWNVLDHNKNDKLTKIIAKHRGSRKMTIVDWEIPIKPTELPLIYRWLESYPMLPPDDFHWSVWEHVYCLFCWLDSGIPFPPNIELSLGTDFVDKVLKNTTEFWRVAHIFHLATDEQKRTICRAEEHRFLKHALANYLNDITDEKCDNGRFLREMDEEVLALPEYCDRFSEAAGQQNFTALMKLATIWSPESQLKLWRTIAYRSLFKVAFQNMEVDFLVHLLALFEKTGEDLMSTAEDTFTVAKSFSAEQIIKLNQLFKYLSRQKTTEIADQLGFVDEFQTAVNSKDYKKLHDMFHAFEHYSELMHAMKEKVEISDCVEYFKHFVIKRHAEGICALLQYVSLEESNTNHRLSKGFSKITDTSEMQRILIAISDKYLQQMLNSFCVYVNADNMPDLTIWQHLYVLFGKLWYFYKHTFVKCK